MKPKLLIVDDRPDAYKLLTHPIRPKYFEMVYEPPLGWIRDEDHCAALMKHLREGAAGEDGRHQHLAVILDLGLREGAATLAVWPSVANQLGDRQPSLAAIAEGARDGFAVLQAIRDCPWIKTAAVIIASGRAGGGVPQVVEEFNRLFAAEGKSIVVSDALGWTAADDKDGKLLVKLAQLWTNSFALHQDPTISSFLTEYGIPFRSPNCAQAAWRHDGWCKDEVGKRAAKDLLRTSLSVDSSSTSSLFMISSNSIGFDDEDREYDLSRDVLKAALDRLEIRAQVIVDGFVRLPCKPGIAFLLALRRLVTELALESAATRMEFRLDVLSHGVRVVLGEHVRRRNQSKSLGGWACVTSFLNKMRHDRKWQFAGDGLSGAICDVACCRVSGLANQNNEAWIEMFRSGLPYWAVWPSFLEDSIEFRW